MTDDTIDNVPTMCGERAFLAERYRVVRQLGQGGMGSVWLVEDTQLDNKQFAIKMLPSILVSNKRAYRQLKDEALVAMKLTHPNIVTLRAFEENNGNPFLVMDYIDGQTLDDYLAEVGNRERGAQQCGLPESDVLRILRPIAAALDYAHGKGVVHRDVKPGNVMIGKDGTPYILDFGIAREIQETMTRVTGRLSSGTLLYMSPEQLNGDAPNPAQDIYSFASMAYECLKGAPPFVRGAIEEQIRNKEPEPPVGRGVPTAPLVAGIMSGLAKTPESRPATCMGVLEGDVAAQGVGPESDATRRHGGSAALVACLLGIVALVCGGYLGWTKYDAMVRAREAEKTRLMQEHEQKEKALQAREEAERKAREEAERKAKEEAERAAKEEAERKAKEEAERAAKEEAERKARDEAARKADAARKAREEAERRDEQERRLKEESERKAAVERKRKEEAALRKAEEERIAAEQKAKVVVERKPMAQVCSRCGGKGIVHMACDGCGPIKDSNGRVVFEHGVYCEACGGKGKKGSFFFEPCSECNGRGWNKHVKCAGSGILRMPCEVCGGKR